jgi:hypothetical protein
LGIRKHLRATALLLGFFTHTRCYLRSMAYVLPKEATKRLTPGDITMPTAERYSRYREDQTTIWVSKTAADYLSRERSTPGEGASAVLDRILNEYKKNRRASGGGSTGGASTKSAAKGASKGGATKSAGKSAGKSASKGGATKRSSAKRGASKGGAKKAARRA